MEYTATMLDMTNILVSVIAPFNLSWVDKVFRNNSPYRTPDNISIMNPKPTILEANDTAMAATRTNPNIKAAYLFTVKNVPWFSFLGVDANH